MIIRVPAKIILFGEHTIVYPNSMAILNAIDLPTTISGELSEDGLNHTYFSSQQIQITAEYSNIEAGDVFKEAIKLHEEFKLHNDISFLKQYLWKQGNFFKSITGLLVSEYPNIKAVNILFNTKAPAGAGLGTSASITAGMINIVLKLNKIDLTTEKLYELTKGIEDLQHGTSSGADPRAVINGGAIKYVHAIDGSKTFMPLKLSPSKLEDIKLIFTGSPKESTGEMVQIVREFKTKNEKRFSEIQSEINGIVADFIANKKDTKSLLNANGILLEELGVVSPQVKAFSAKIRSNGGAIKIAGAGGSSSASGVCICQMQDEQLLEGIINGYDFNFIKAKILVKGETL